MILDQEKITWIKNCSRPGLKASRYQIFLIIWKINRNSVAKYLEISYHRTGRDEDVWEREGILSLPQGANIIDAEVR